MKAALPVVLGVLPTFSTVEYGAMETLELVLRADAIVEGVVASTGRVSDGVATSRSAEPATFTIAVAEVIHGQVNSDEITILEFVDWMCAARYGPYAEGQRAIFFLQYQCDDDGQALVDQPYRVMGTGNDGECPVVDGTVLHHDYMLEGLPTAQLNAFGHECRGMAAPRDQFVSAVKGLRGCFSWPSEAAENGLPKAQREPRQICSDAELTSFMGSSALADAMVRSSYTYKRLVEVLVGRNPEQQVSEDKGSVTMNLAFVLLSEPRSIEGDEVVQAFKAFASHDQRLIVKPTTPSESSLTALEFEVVPRGSAMLVTMPHAVPNREADERARFSVSSMGTGWTLPEHKAQVMVIFRAAHSASPVEAVSLFTSLLAATAKASGAVGIYWGGARATHDAGFFISTAESQGVVPRISLWTGVSVADESDGGVSLLSLGMKQLSLPDLLLVASKPSREAALGVFFDLLGYVAELGSPIREGETVGRDDTERLPVTYVPSPIDPTSKVWRVELK